MLLAITGTKSGKRMLIVGLVEENVERLQNDEPILVNFEGEGITELKEWEMTIFGPEDTARFLAQFGPQLNDT